MVAPAIEVVRSERLAHAIVRSNWRGTSYATLVLKGTFGWTSAHETEVLEPDPIVQRDAPRSTDPRSSLVAASELAPYLAQAAVVCTGLAHPPTARRSATFPVKLTVLGARGAIVEKELVATSDGGEPVPLVYEEALMTPDNPAGVARPRCASSSASGSTTSSPVSKLSPPPSGAPRP